MIIHLYYICFIYSIKVKIHQRGGAVETGCSDVYDVAY